MAEHACVQVYPCARACQEWAAAEKTWLVPADTSDAANCPNISLKSVSF